MPSSPVAQVAPGFRVRRLRALAKPHLDVLPVWDMVLRLRQLHRVVWWTAWEHREVARQRRAGATARPATVTVVLPTYRRPDYLAAAVESVLSQTWTDFTLVVVDDGGGEVTTLPADPRIHVVPLARNTAVLGVVNNVGIRLSESRYVALLNDDNTWRPRHLACAVAALEAGADVVYAGMRRHLPDGEHVDELAVPFARRAMRRSAFTDSSTLTFRRGRRTLFSRARRGKKDFPKEDWEFVWRLSRHRRTRLVPEVTVDYLIHPGSYLTNWEPFLARERAAGHLSNHAQEEAHGGG